MTTVGMASQPAASAEVSNAVHVTTESVANVTRLFGSTRYETAVAISELYSPDQKAVFVATGADFPDALSAAAAAGAVGGPILLTPATWIQQSVLTEIARISPDVVYVLGGPSVISASVLSRISEVAPARRIYGADRYETSRKLVERFHPQAAEIFLATGRGYADALAASAAAARRGVPTLLVDGDRSTLDSATLAQFDATGPRTVWLAGGHGAVSIGIEQQLRTMGLDVKRYGGATRYDTAAAIMAAFNGDGPKEIYLASGENFPDALAAAAAVGQRDGALYLARSTCVPAAAHAAIEAFGSVDRTVVGGPAVVSEAAAANTGCGDEPPSAPTFATSGFTISTSVEAPYFDRAPVDVHDPAIVLDSTGLRVLNFGPGGTRTDHPVAYAQYGISALLEYQQTGEQLWLDRALRQAERLVQIHTDRGEAWYYPYLFNWSYGGETLRAPWWSAMAQGEALSLFVRLHEETGDGAWRIAADHTWNSLLQPRSAAEPWATTVLERDILWFEEYAGNLAPLRVLNGHIFATFGVYDYWKLTGNSTALDYLDGAASAVLEAMPMIRAPGGVSYYCWRPTCRTTAWQYSLYHTIHSWQLDTLARLTGDVRFTEWADLLRADWSPTARMTTRPLDVVEGGGRPPM